MQINNAAPAARLLRIVKPARAEQRHGLDGRLPGFSLARYGRRRMPQTWYVTFEVHKRGTLPKRRSPRQTRTFQSEADARAFARMKVDEGLIVYAGTINPLLPRRSISSGDILSWIEQGQSDAPADRPQTGK